MSDIKKIIQAIYCKSTQSLPCCFSKARLSIQIQVSSLSLHHKHLGWSVLYAGDYKMIIERDFRLVRESVCHITSSRHDEIICLVYSEWMSGADDDDPLKMENCTKTSSKIYRIKVSSFLPKSTYQTLKLWNMDTFCMQNKEWKISRISARITCCGFQRFDLDHACI